jgi:hypothetical protein
VVLRSYLHPELHVLVPAAVAAIFFRGRFLRAWIIMTLTMLVDLDHFLASPVYDLRRCSIGFHPLHQYPAIAVYGLLLIWPSLRLVATGLLIHMALDCLDCIWMRYEI